MLRIRRKKNISGTPLFLRLLIGIIFGYVLIHLFIYQQSDKTAIYEVRYGYLSRNNVLRGLCIRDEKVFISKSSGFVNYFVSSPERVGVNSTVYSLDNNGSIYEYIKDTREELNEEEFRGIRELSREFLANYDSSDFYQVFSYNSGLDTYLANIKADKALKKLKKLDEKTSLNFTRYKAEASGNIAFYTDGFENKTENQVVYDELYDRDYLRTVINNNDRIQQGDPVYKLLKNERWKILCPIEPEVSTQLEEIIRNKGNTDGRLFLPIKFLKDSTYTNCTLEIKKKNGKEYILLLLTDSAARFLNDRYLDVELQLKQNFGLQIPLTSLVQKNYYRIPKEYGDRGGNSLGNTFGVIKKVPQTEDNKLGRQFVEASNVDLGDDFIYVSADKLEDSPVVVHPTDNTTEYSLSDKISLNGVYNINKGYAVFQYVEIIDKNDQYYIVDDKRSMVSEFDHIILEGKFAEENMILNQKGVK